MARSRDLPSHSGRIAEFLLSLVGQKWKAKLQALERGIQIAPTRTWTLQRAAEEAEA
jgi:hypothetical protein